MAESSKRQREYKDRLLAQGFVQVSGFVPREVAAEMNILMRRLREDKDLEPALRSTVTGRFTRV